MAAAAAAIALIIGLPGGSAPERALADVVREKVAASVAALEDVRLSGRWHTRHIDPVPFRLPLTSEGDLFFHQEGTRGVQGADISRTITVAYDARRSTEHTLLPGAPAGEFEGVPFDATPPLFSARTGVPPGPPDRAVNPLLGLQQLRAAVEALLADDDPLSARPAGAAATPGGR